MEVDAPVAAAYNGSVNWLGIAILATFSLGLSLFMRLEPGKPRRLPKGVGQWQRSDDASEGEGTYVETRLLLHERGWLRRHRLVQQCRVRSEADARILRVLPERVVDRWWGRFES